ncbi:MAG: NifB/NifX family molybdenum-iron cluster-binding protein [Candidatus Aminicenantes bacterium]|nr:NifB/NifX family molybdenum-iron cluster-binding protein [Candidatus Aminicenantes bacterium]
MKKAAFAFLEKRIAPVFDTARQFYVIEVESGQIIGEAQEIVTADLPLQKVLRLTELGIDTLICGAISRPLHAMVVAYGIQVIPFVAGNLEDVIRAWLKGGSLGNHFAMPGCCRSVRRHFGKLDDIYQEERIMNGKGQGGMGAGGGQGQGGMGGGGGRGQGRGGQGRGRMGGLRAGGDSGTCLCPKCGQRVAHERGVPCVQRQCPQCGSAMTRE